MNTVALLFRLGFRNIWRSPRRSAITMAAIALAIWSSLSLASVARGMTKMLRAEGIRNLLGHVQLHDPKYLADPSIEYRFSLNRDEILTALKPIPLKGMAFRVRLPGVVRSEREASATTLVGIDPIEERETSFIGTAPINGKMIAADDTTGIVLGKKLLERLSTGVGKRVVVMTERSDNTIADRGFRIVGEFDAELDSTETGFAFVSRKALQELAGMNSEISEISVLAAEEDLEPKLHALLQSSFPKLDVKSWMEVEPFLKSMSEVQNGFLTLWFTFVVVIVGFGLINALLMSMFERKREFGMVQALGMTRPQLIGQICAECFFLVLFGAVLGNLMFAGTLHILSDGIDLSAFARGLEHFGFGRIVFPFAKPFDMILLNTLIVVVALVGSLYPAWKTARRNIVESLSAR